MNRNVFFETLANKTKKLSQSVSRSQGIGLFLVGFTLCLVGFSILSARQTLLYSDLFEEVFVFTSALIFFPLLIFVGRVLISNSKQYLQIYRFSIVLLTLIFVVTFVEKYYLATLSFSLVTWATAICLAGFATFALVATSKTKELPLNFEYKQTPFSEIREKLQRIIFQSENQNTQMKLLQNEMENWGSSSWRKEKELTNNYNRVVSDLFLVLDHFQVLLKNNKTTELTWIYKRTKQILEDEGIEEIKVKQGEKFNALYHKFAGDRLDTQPNGSILEVTRKGYLIKAQMSKNDLILRAAEVIISRNKLETENSKTNIEVEK